MTVGSMPLNNGYSIVIDRADVNKIAIFVADPDGSYNQGLVDIVPDYDTKDGEIDIYCYLDPNAPTYDTLHTVEIKHDPIIEDDEEADNEEMIDAQMCISYGDHGTDVMKIQKRLKELGYFNGTIGGNYLTKTSIAVEAFQLANGLHVNGAYMDDTTEKYLFSKNAIPVEKIVEKTETSSQEYAKEMDWWKSDIQKIFAKGTVAQITDVETGVSWKEKRRGGTNHADVEPLTYEDTTILKSAYNGKWSWNRRAIWVTIDGVTYAASMNGMPHGGSSINNGFDGHHCIHFTNSRTHCSNKVCPNHQKAIKKAASTKLK